MSKRKRVQFLPFWICIIKMLIFWNSFVIFQTSSKYFCLKLRYTQFSFVYIKIQRVKIKLILGIQISCMQRWLKIENAMIIINVPYKIIYIAHILEYWLSFNQNKNYFYIEVFRCYATLLGCLNTLFPARNNSFIS